MTGEVHRSERSLHLHAGSLSGVGTDPDEAEAIFSAATGGSARLCV